MKKHTIIGGRALDKIINKMNIKYFVLGREIAYHHHEKYDGSGYPYGLKGDEIPLSARIVAISDVYDALTSDRHYRKAMNHSEAICIIKDEMGEKHFDPIILHIFLDIAVRFEEIALKYGSKDDEKYIY